MTYKTYKLSYDNGYVAHKDFSVFEHMVDAACEITKDLLRTGVLDYVPGSVVIEDAYPRWDDGWKKHSCLVNLKEEIIRNVKATDFQYRKVACKEPEDK